MTEEFPIFVRFGDDRLAAVVTTPDPDPLGVVFLLQGLGAPRSHAYQLWTRTARSLAREGLASVRMDYPQLGDSTGILLGDLKDPPVDEARAVAELILETLATDKLGVIGNCMGARTALLLAARLSECTSVGCIVPSSAKTFLIGGGKVAMHRAARQLGRRAPRLARRARRLLHTDRIRPRMRFLPEVGRAMRSADLNFLFLGSEEPAGRLADALEELRQEEGTARRVEVRFLPAGNTSGMRLPIDLQERVVEQLTSWMVDTLGDPFAGEAAWESGVAHGTVPSIEGRTASDRGSW